MRMRRPAKNVAAATTNPDAAPLVTQNESPAVASQAVEAPRSRPALDLGLADVFEEFASPKKRKVARLHDYETHYNMGIAYKEMDLLDEAVREFQAAAALVSGDDGTPRS